MEIIKDSIILDLNFRKIYVFVIVWVEKLENNIWLFVIVIVNYIKNFENF